MGGSLLNVACGLVPLGYSNSLVSWWAADTWGRAIEAHLAGYGVGVIPVTNRAQHIPVATVDIRRLRPAELSVRTRVAGSAFV